MRRMRLGDGLREELGEGGGRSRRKLVVGESLWFVVEGRWGARGWGVLVDGGVGGGVRGRRAIGRVAGAVSWLEGVRLRLNGVASAVCWLGCGRERR